MHVLQHSVLFWSSIDDSWNLVRFGKTKNRHQYSCKDLALEPHSAKSFLCVSCSSKQIWFCGNLNHCVLCLFVWPTVQQTVRYPRTELTCSVSTVISVFFATMQHLASCFFCVNECRNIKNDDHVSFPPQVGKKHKLDSSGRQNKRLCGRMCVIFSSYTRQNEHEGNWCEKRTNCVL